MSITSAHTTDLEPGDLVQIHDERWPNVTTCTGPLWLDENGGLRCASLLICRPDGSTVERDKTSLTVLHRKPRPLYVNHPRTAPWPGDVVRDAERAGPSVWMADRNGGWWLASMGTVRLKERHDLPARLILLVDGETGQVVQ